jgi:hypothetical protein
LALCQQIAPSTSSITDLSSVAAVRALAKVFPETEITTLLLQRLQMVARRLQRLSLSALTTSMARLVAVAVVAVRVAQLRLTVAALGAAALLLLEWVLVVVVLALGQPVLAFKTGRTILSTKTQ